MVILGFMLNYMLRVNLTIAIVAMVIPNKTSHSNLSDVNHECSGAFLSTAINNRTIKNLEDIDDINNVTQVTERVRNYFFLNSKIFNKNK